MSAVLITLAGALFSIPSGPAPLTLNEFSAQSGYQALFGTDALNTYVTNAVEGDMDPGDALDRMLEGTGITYALILSPKGITVGLVPPRKAMAESGPADMIGEDCTFDAIPSHISEERLGHVEGHCWCCTLYDERYREYLYLQQLYESGKLTEEPAKVSPPGDFFCASFRTENACTDYDTQIMSREWNEAPSQEVSVTAAAHSESAAP